MLRKLSKKLAVILSLAMVITMLPGNAQAVKAAEEGTSTVFTLDASTLDSTAFGGYDVNTNTDVRVGDYFTILGKSTSPSRQAKTKLKNEETAVTYGVNSFTQAVYLTGAMKDATGQAAIEFTVAEGKTAKLTVIAAAKSDAASNLKYAKGGVATVMGALTFGEVAKYEAELSAGTYYLGGSNGAFIYYVEVKYLDKYVLDPNDEAFVAKFPSTNKLTANTTAGTDDYFTMISTKSKAVLVKDKNLEFEGETYKNAYRLDGAGNTSGQACFKVTLAQEARVTILAAGKNDKGSKFEYVKVGESAFTKYGSALVKDVISKNEIVLPAGSYYIGTDQGADMYSIVVEYVQTYELNPNDEAFVANFAANAKGNLVISADTTAGTDGFFTMMSAGSKSVLVKDKNLTFDDVTYANAYRLDGTAKTNGQACFKISVKENAKVTILAAGKNDKGSQFEIVKVGGTAFTTFGKALTKDVISKTTLTDLLPGDYYIGTTQGADLYSIVVEYDANSEEIAAKDWAEVAAPVINSVTVDAEGNFVVEVAVVLDAIEGASSLTVTMLYGDGQGAETTVVSAPNGKATVTFTPAWSGDYTFVATAQRAGCPDKASAAVEYKDYALAVKKPVINWAQNMGEGTVYLDWVNIADADSYTVSYKVKDADDSTYVDKTVTTGNYTLTGLEAGKTYTVKVVATRNADNYTATATRDVAVTAEADQQWYVATVGSAQATTGTITEADGTATTIDFNSSDTIAANGGTKTNQMAAPTIANTTGTIALDGQSSGKISDDEDGYSYYFTKINPNTENFTMTATFEVTDISLTPDNQTGFGIIAADILGINNWGSPDYVHKYFNYFSSMVYSTKTSAPSMRYITGYSSADASNKDGAERVNNNIQFTNLKDSDLFTVGKTYTLTVSKTDDGYVATAKSAKGEQTLKLDENALTSVQEDGTICVGVFVSRKVSVKITDITFAKSESKGLAGKDASGDKVAPSVAVYSSNTCGAGEYEFTAVANCAGTFTITNNTGKTETVEAVADQVVRVMLPIHVGDNKITANFAPKGDNITSTAVVTKEVTVKCERYGKEGETIYVAADGKATGDGTAEKPLDLATAVKYAQPGQVIIMKNGVYSSGATIYRSVSGTADKNITLVAESISTNGEDGVVITGSGLIVIGNYWHIYGIYVKEPAGVGIQVSGNYNTIEMCTVEHATNSGIQISRNGSASNTAGIQGKLWPTGNLIKNCESFDNCDAARNDADGFAAKLTCGNDNKFYGCISHNNIDDGWDLYAKSVSGEIGKVVIENCVAYNNGWCTFDFESAATYNYGEGNGFKLGGGYLKGGHELINSVAFGNHAKGVTSNSCPDIVIKNVTAYGNGNASSYSIGLNTMDSMLKEWKVSGLISYTKNTSNADLIPFSLHSADNYIFDGAKGTNNQGVSVENKWFTSVDLSIVPTRNADGTINMNNLLILTDAAPANSGARLDVTSDAAKSVSPAATTVVGANGIYEEDGKLYYFENGVKVVPTEGRGKEVYDRATDSWYFIETSNGGQVAANKEVFLQDNEDGSGRWVRYDANGKMIKGFFVDADGNGFYYDETTGAMTKGAVVVDGLDCYFDEETGKGAEGWRAVDGVTYWYEDGIRQGYNANDPAFRGKEIYDPASDAWYWLDNVQNGAVAKSKDVYMESLADAEGTIGKWVRYDADGHMVKGWDTNEAGTYYFDLTYGTMAKGVVTIDGKRREFDVITGILKEEPVVIVENGFMTFGGKSYWYENGVLQGIKYNEDGTVDESYRGKEIYDEATQSWYWLDAVQGGAKTVSKDVYLADSVADAEGTVGKWVRYDADGHMVKGWDTNEAGTYYFDPVYGTMVKGVVIIDGSGYYFNEITGILEELLGYGQ